MSTSELITPGHLARKAIIYIRQSTPQQVLSNQESLHLQYALRQRALELGWCADDIQIIDTDLGLTAASAQHRQGFQELASLVALGQVGIVLSYEVTRLSRNCSDWYPLLDVCGYQRCLIADRDGVYDPASANGRLLLGLKGQLSELELHTLRGRLTAGLFNKAQRGELALRLPIGLVRDDLGRVAKDPNREVQTRIELVFSSFLRLRSACKVLRFLNEGDLLLPRHDGFGDLVWKKPTTAAILALLKNPAYAGAFTYGRSRTTRNLAGQAITRRLPQDQWRVCVRDKYPAYISWETFTQIQAMLEDNYAEYDRNQTRGVPRPGSALLHGLVYCGACGHKMVVQYKKGTRYLCNYLRQQHGVPVCQNIPGDPVDAAVVTAFFQALSPVELDVYATTLAAQQETQRQIEHAQRQQIERLRYEAARAQRQYNQVDPENRLVAAELEQRWEAALRALKQAEDTSAQQPANARPAAEQLPAELRAAFEDIGQRLPAVWRQGLLKPQTQKALLRCLIDKVVLHRLTPDSVQARIVWRGGDTTTLQVAVTTGAFADLTTSAAMERTILELATQGQSDEAIAQHLTQLGHHSPKNTQTVLTSTVRIIRQKHRIFPKRSQSHPRRIAGYLTVPQIAEALGISPYWIYHRIDNGTVQVTKDANTGLYLFPDEPATLELFRRLREGQSNTPGSLTEHQDV